MLKNCSICHKTFVKLWRPINNISDSCPLICSNCAKKRLIFKQNLVLNNVSSEWIYDIDVPEMILDIDGTDLLLAPKLTIVPAITQNDTYIRFSEIPEILYDFWQSLLD